MREVFATGYFETRPALLASRDRGGSTCNRGSQNGRRPRVSADRPETADGVPAICSSLGKPAQRRQMRRYLTKVVRCRSVSSRASAAGFGTASS